MGSLTQPHAGTNTSYVRECWEEPQKLAPPKWFLRLEMFALQACLFFGFVAAIGLTWLLYDLFR